MVVDATNHSSKIFGGALAFPPESVMKLLMYASHQIQGLSGVMRGLCTPMDRGWNPMNVGRGVSWECSFILVQMNVSGRPLPEKRDERDEVLSFGGLG